MNAMGTDIKGCLFTGFPNCHFKIFGHFLNYFLNSGRMYPPVIDQLYESQPGNFPANRVKTGKNDRLGSIINDNIDTSGGLNSSDIPPFPANDSSFHLITG